MLNIPSLKDKVSPEEWQLRVDLAACYRLIAAYGWSDLVFTHVSARIPGPEHHFLINPYGLMFDEITASSLVKIDQSCNKLSESAYRREPGGLHNSQLRSRGTGRRGLCAAHAHAGGHCGQRPKGRFAAA